MADKTFDEIFSALLTDIQNNCPGADVSQGSPLFANAAAVASAVWGLYNQLSYNAQQIFPDTADTARLERWCWIFNIAREPDETDAELLARLLARIRQAPAGGNKADYVTWAESVTGVASAKCVSCPRGPGTVDVVILADKDLTGSEMPSVELLAAVYDYIDGVRPVTAGELRVVAAQIIEQDVTLAITGSAPGAQADITAAMAAMTIAETLVLTRLGYIALEAGATDAVISVPESNVAATDYQVIRPGTITVN